MHAKKTLEPGTWYAGYHAPFFVSRPMVAAALGKLGLTDVRFFDRSATAVVLPVDPKLDPAYDDQWDTWLEATYAGATKPVDVPAQVSWLLHSSAAAAKPGAPLAPAPPAATPASRKGLLILLLLYLLSEE